MAKLSNEELEELRRKVGVTPDQLGESKPSGRNRQAPDLPAWVDEWIESLKK